MGIMLDLPFGPPVASVPLPDSPLVFVVTQIRFPLVASINDPAFVGPFQERIRRTYNDLRQDQEILVTLGPDGATNQQKGSVWRFSDEPGGWEVALAPEFIALATRRYTSRSDFMGRLGALLEAFDAWLQPTKVRRVGVRYIDRIGEAHLNSIDRLVRREVLGPLHTGAPPDGHLRQTLTDSEYQFTDATGMRARWGVLPPKATFDPAIEPWEEPSWVLDIDAWLGERPFDPDAIRRQVQALSDRIYRYFRWVVTDDFLTTFGADS